PHTDDGPTPYGPPRPEDEEWSPSAGTRVPGEVGGDTFPRDDSGASDCEHSTGAVHAVRHADVRDSTPRPAPGYCGRSSGTTGRPRTAHPMPHGQIGRAHV